MGAKRVEYQIVGRYMNGKEVTGYHLQSIDTGKQGKYTREQVCFLVGRDQVTNCTAQLSADKIILRGKGISLDELPVQYEDGTTKNMEQLGRIKRGTSAQDAMSMFTLVGSLKQGRNTVGYVVQNAGCGIKRLNRQQVLELAQRGRIGNARVQMYQGKALLRGVGCNLDDLPSEDITPKQPQAQAKPAASRVKPIIYISQLKYNQGMRKMIPNLVFFGAETVEEVNKLKEVVSKATNGRQAFTNTNDIDQISVNGKTYQAIMDNGVYTIERYRELAGALKVAFEICPDDIVDMNEEPIEFDKALASLKEQYSLGDASKATTKTNRVEQSRVEQSSDKFIIRITQLQYYGSTVDPVLVEFGATTAKDAQDFKQAVNKLTKGKQAFSNTNDFNETKINGKKYIVTFDDAAFDIKAYKALATKTKAKLVIDTDDIIDEDYEPVEDKATIAKIRKMIGV